MIPDDVVDEVRARADIVDGTIRITIEGHTE